MPLLLQRRATVAALRLQRRRDTEPWMGHLHNTLPDTQVGGASGITDATPLKIPPSPAPGSFQNQPPASFPKPTISLMAVFHCRHIALGRTLTCQVWQLEDTTTIADGKAAMVRNALRCGLAALGGSRQRGRWNKVVGERSTVALEACAPPRLVPVSHTGLTVSFTRPARSHSSSGARLGRILRKHSRLIWKTCHTLATCFDCRGHARYTCHTCCPLFGRLATLGHLL